MTSTPQAGNKNPNIDAYLVEGCGRCPLGNTPGCKVNPWRDTLSAVRDIVLGAGLTEERKWGVPCYTHNKRNVVILSALKESCVLSFFKGALMKDPKNILEKPGENTQVDRLIRLTSLKQAQKLAPTIKAYIREAIALEDSGAKPEPKKNSEPIPQELQEKLNEDPALKTAFQNLTPGRQRGYILHIAAPKQSKTRTTRAEKCIPKILEGKGFHDR